MNNEKNYTSFIKTLKTLVQRHYSLVLIELKDISDISVPFKKQILKLIALLNIQLQHLFNSKRKVFTLSLLSIHTLKKTTDRSFSALQTRKLTGILHLIPNHCFRHNILISVTYMLMFICIHICMQK